MGKRLFKTYSTEVKGLLHKSPDIKERQKILEKCRIGEKLKLIHSHSLHNADAIKVYRYNGPQIGWLSGDIAEEIAPIIDNSEEIQAKISKITKSKFPFRRKYSCTVRIAVYSLKKYFLEEYHGNN